MDSSCTPPAKRLKAGMHSVPCSAGQGQPQQQPRALENGTAPSKSASPQPGRGKKKAGPPIPATHVAPAAERPARKRRAVSFPPGSVEAAKPVLQKRRRLTAADVGKRKLLLFCLRPSRGWVLPSPFGTVLPIGRALPALQEVSFAKLVGTFCRSVITQG